MELALNNLQRLICHKTQPKLLERIKMFSEETDLHQTLTIH